MRLVMKKGNEQPTSIPTARKQADQNEGGKKPILDEHKLGLL